MEKPLPTIFADGLILFFTMIVLFIALLKGVQGLIVLTLLILIFIYGAKLWSKAGKKNVFLHFDAESKRMFPGEDIPVSLAIENKKILPVWLKIEFPGSKIEFLEFDAVKDSSLLWYQKIAWQLKITVSQRGWYLLNPPALMVGDPFGLFQERKNLSTEPVEVIVYPAIFPLQIPYLPRKLFKGDIIDRYGLVQDPVFFSGSREYQYGQPAKHINWKASARYQTLQEKIFDASTELNVLFLIDVDHFGEDEVCFEKMLETAASLAVQLEREGYSFSLIANGYLDGRVEKRSAYLPAKRNGDQLPAFLELLARLKQESCYSMENLLEEEILPQGCTGLHFTYSRTEEFYSVEELMREKRIPVLNIVCRPDDDINKRTDNFYCLEDFLTEPLPPLKEEEQEDEGEYLC